MGHTAHQRSEYQIPAKHGRAECVHLDPLRENESHEGCVAADARLCSSLSFYPARPSGRGRAAIAKWSTKPCLLPRHASTKSPLSNRKNTIATPPRASSTST